MERGGAKVPKDATGRRMSNGYTEWFRGDATKGWRLISTDAPSIDSVDTTLPVMPFIVPLEV